MSWLAQAWSVVVIPIPHARLEPQPPDTFFDMNDKQAFIQFYDAYAPKLWGLIVGAKLPQSRSEAILSHTLTKGWQELGKDFPKAERVLTTLLRFAHEEGLPTDYLRCITLK